MAGGSAPWRESKEDTVFQSAENIWWGEGGQGAQLTSLCSQLCNKRSTTPEKLLFLSKHTYTPNKQVIQWKALVLSIS